MNPLNRTCDIVTKLIADLDKQTEIPRLDEVTMEQVAVTEMEAELDAFGNVVGEAGKTGDDAFEKGFGDVDRPERDVFQRCDFDGDVDLDREFGVGDRVLDDLERMEECFLVEGLDGTFEGSGDEGHYVDETGDTDLKSDVLGYNTLSLFLPEYVIGFKCMFMIACIDLPKFSKAGGYFTGREGRRTEVEFLVFEVHHDDNFWSGREVLKLPADEVVSLSSFAIWDPAKSLRKKSWYIVEDSRG